MSKKNWKIKGEFFKKNGVKFTNKEKEKMLDNLNQFAEDNGCSFYGITK